MTKPQKTHFADDATLERLVKLERVYEAAISGMERFARDGYPFPRELRAAITAVQTGLDSNEN